MLRGARLVDRRLVGAALFLAAAATPTLARADAADEWVERGIQLRRARNDAEALEYFRRAYEMHPTPRTRVQMALAEQALGRWIEAEADLEEALKAQGEPWIDRNRDKLSAGLATIGEHLGWLRVDSQPGAELWVNGARIGTLPLDGVRVVAGSVWVELRAPEFEPWQQSIEIEPKEIVRVVAPLAHARAATSPVPAATTIVPRRASVRTSPQKTMAWVALGAGGLLLAEGAVAQVVRSQASAHYNDDSLCLAPGLTRDQLCGSYRGRAEAAQTFATVGWIGGGIAASAGLVLLLTSPSEPAPPVAVNLAPHELGFWWWGSF